MSTMRRSMMFVPGNNPGMLQNAGIYGADTIIFDVEDSVALTEKDAARNLVRNAIELIRYPCEVAVRINHIETPFGLADLQAILPSKPDLIRLPKAETADDIRQVDQLIAEAEQQQGFAPGSIKLMAAIETAKGILNAYDIVTASSRMVAIAIGGEDFVADLRTCRTRDGKELFAARSHLVLAGRAAGIHVVDSVFANVNDEEGFIAETKMIKELGFDGKSVINPRQIRLVHQVFAPSPAEVERARRVIAAYEEALAKKSGVIALDGKMIDTPVVARAQRILDYAAAVGMNQEGLS